MKDFNPEQDIKTYVFQISSMEGVGEKKNGMPVKLDPWLFGTAINNEMSINFQVLTHVVKELTGSINVLASPFLLLRSKSGSPTDAIIFTCRSELLPVFNIAISLAVPDYDVFLRFIAANGKATFVPTPLCKDIFPPRTVELSEQAEALHKVIEEKYSPISLQVIMNEDDRKDLEQFLMNYRRE